MAWLTLSVVPESVWDYPRPPAVQKSDRLIEIDFGGETIVSTREAVRVLETSHPPVYYVPTELVSAELRPIDKRTVCEFKGVASYYDVVVGDRNAAGGAWSYPSPAAGYEELAGRVAFYPSVMDECRVDGEPVTAQSGDFYGGWITGDIVGPFKGGPGTAGW